MQRIIITLGERQKEKVRILYKTTKNTRLKERYQALLLAHEGKLPEEIKGIVKRNVLTVRRWLRNYQRRGLPGLTVGHGPGRPARMNKRQIKTLVETAAKSPRFSGYEFSIWTCKGLGVLLNQRFNVSLSAERIRQILKKEGLTVGKPAYLYAKQNQKKEKYLLQK